MPVRNKDQTSSHNVEVVETIGSQSSRWTYHIENNEPIVLVPEFEMLGSDEIRKAISLNEHEHPGCFEFVFIERGKASWEVDGTVYETQAGDLFHSLPGEKHRGNFNVIEPCKLWWLIVTAPHHEGWLQLATEESMQIEKALAQLPRVVHTSLKPIESYKKLKSGLMHKNPFQSMVIRHAILDLLLIFLQPSPSSTTVANDLLRQFDSLINKMKRKPEWRPSVQELADITGVSPSHFYRTFQEYTGEAPITYVERLRIKEASIMLRGSNDSITEIAFHLGYQSSQHFATVFKRFLGTTPTQWRKVRN